MQRQVLSVLVIDDELAIRQIMQNLLEINGYDVETVGSGEEAKAIFKEKHFDVSLCDVRLGDCIGIDLVKQLKDEGIETEFIIMTAFASVSTAIDAMRAGAFDYLMKPMRNEDVLHRLKQVQQMLSLKKENRNLRRQITDTSQHIFQPQSEVMKQIYKLVEKVARSERDIIITGASGTGKGILSREIHRLGSRINGPFVQINCAAIPENLLESELFGHVKGAFTGADKSKTGLFVEANGGIIFLDEIGEMPLSMQAKLLHAIEEKTIRPVGSNQQISIDIRIISATNCNLLEMIEEKKFREDLYFRLQVLQIELPPLKDRHGDIVPLIDFFIAKECHRMGLNQKFTIDPDAYDCLINYSYPGNLREMENTLARAVALAEDYHIMITDLPPVFLKGSKSYDNSSPTLRERVRLFEQQIIKETLSNQDNDRRKVAEILGLGLSSLYRKIEEMEDEDAQQ